MAGSLGLPQPGDLVGGKYLLETIVGQSESEALFGARHTVTGRRFAIRWLSWSGAGRGSEHEAGPGDVIGCFQHSMVLSPLDAGATQDALYLVMEWLDGETLCARLQRVRTLTLADAAKLLMPCLRVMQEAHEADLVHGELRPGRIFIVRGSGLQPESVRIFAYALARHGLAAPLLTADGLYAAGAHYLAPEQIKGSAVSCRSDVYAFGVILYRALTGQMPFAQDRADELARWVYAQDPEWPSPDVPAGASQLAPATYRFLMQAMARDPEQRFSSCGELASALESLLHTRAASGRSIVGSKPRNVGALGVERLVRAPTLRLNAVLPASTPPGLATSEGCAVAFETSKPDFVLLDDQSAAYELCEAGIEPATQESAGELPPSAVARRVPAMPPPLPGRGGRASIAGVGGHVAGVRRDADAQPCRSGAREVGAAAGSHDEDVRAAAPAADVTAGACAAVDRRAPNPESHPAEGGQPRDLPSSHEWDEPDGPGLVAAGDAARSHGRRSWLIGAGLVLVGVIPWFVYSLPRPSGHGAGAYAPAGPASLQRTDMSPASGAALHGRSAAVERPSATAATPGTPARADAADVHVPLAIPDYHARGTAATAALRPQGRAQTDGQRGEAAREPAPRRGGESARSAADPSPRRVEPGVAPEIAPSARHNAAASALTTALTLPHVGQQPELAKRASASASARAARSRAERSPAAELPAIADRPRAPAVARVLSRHVAAEPARPSPSAARPGASFRPRAATARRRPDSAPAGDKADKADKARVGGMSLF